MIIVHVKMNRMKSLLLLLMLAALILSSEAVKCYLCVCCNEPTYATCEGEVCLKITLEATGALWAYNLF